MLAAREAMLDFRPFARLSFMGNAEIDQPLPDDETEQLALAAAEAIKRLVQERHALRRELVVKEGELQRLHERFILVRDSYRRLANELVGQLKLFEKLEHDEARATGSAELHWLRGERRD
jgi:hypothetical protein